MELSLKAQPADTATAHTDTLDSQDMLSAGKDASLLAAGKFWTQIRATQKRGELAATAMIMLCGGILSCLLAIANAADRLTSLRQ